MRRALLVILVLVAVAAVAVFGALKLIPDSVYREEITKAAHEATGRDVTIEGGIGISLYPVLGVKAEGVTLANAPGFAAPYFARMKELDAGVKLWPLFSGKVEIARFALVEPEIALEVDAKGNNNWTFETAEKKAVEPEEEDGGGAELSELSLGTMRLVDGQVSYANKQSGEKWQASDINLAVSLPNLDAPLNVDGDAKWKGQAVSLALKAEKPRALFDGEASPVALDVKSALLKLAFAGDAKTGDALTLSGPLDLSTPSLRKLLSWLSEPGSSNSGGEGKTFGAFAIKGDLALKGDVTRIDNAVLSLDGMNGKGKLSVNSAPARPRPLIAANFALDRLDVDSLSRGLERARRAKRRRWRGGGGTIPRYGRLVRRAHGFLRPQIRRCGSQAQRRQSDVQRHDLQQRDAWRSSAGRRADGQSARSQALWRQGRGEDRARWQRRHTVAALRSRLQRHRARAVLARHGRVHGPFGHRRARDHDDEPRHKRARHRAEPERRRHAQGHERHAARRRSHGHDARHLGRHQSLGRHGRLQRRLPRRCRGRRAQDRVLRARRNLRHSERRAHEQGSRRW